MQTFLKACKLAQNNYELKDKITKRKFVYLALEILSFKSKYKTS